MKYTFLPPPTFNRHLAILPLCAAQFILNASACLPDSGITAFPDCNYLSDTISECAGPDVASGAPYIACMCNQELFNSYFGCDSEERLCFGNSDLDPSIQSGIDQWHSICDGRIPFSPTTPAVSSITASFIPSNCLAAEAACASAAAGNSACSVSYAGKSQTESFSSCLCQPSILSQEYTCAFLGNMSCQQTSAALSNMAEYSFYSNLVSVVGGNNGTGPNSAPATATSPRTISVFSAISAASTTQATHSITQPALPSPSTSNTSATPTKLSVVFLACVPNLAIRAACWAFLTMALIMIT